MKKIITVITLLLITGICFGQKKHSDGIHFRGITHTPEDSMIKPAKRMLSVGGKGYTNTGYFNNSPNYPPSRAKIDSIETIAGFINEAIPLKTILGSDSVGIGGIKACQKIKNDK